MRFMMLLKANQDTEAGVMPTPDELVQMGRYNEQLIAAGVMLAGDGLQASSKGARVQFSGGNRAVVEGPFPETRELIAGFWIIQAKSKEEAIEWAKRAPFSGEGQIEVRQMYDAEDFEDVVAGSAEGRATLDAEKAFRAQTTI